MFRATLPTRHPKSLQIVRQRTSVVRHSNLWMTDVIIGTIATMVLADMVQVFARKAEREKEKREREEQEKTDADV